MESLSSETARMNDNFWSNLSDDISKQVNLPLKPFNDSNGFYSFIEQWKGKKIVLIWDEFDRYATLAQSDEKIKDTYIELLEVLRGMRESLKQPILY